MSHVTAEEWQFLSFFAVEPTLADADVPWCYNEAVYKVSRGGLALSFAIDPAYCDLRIILQHDTHSLYEFDATAIHDVRYAKDDGHEQLEVVVSDRESILLRITPRIVLTHTYDGTPRLHVHEPRPRPDE